MIFCGGDASEYFPRESATSNELKRILLPLKNDRGNVIAAICTGQEVLLTHGLLARREVAVCPLVKDQWRYQEDGIRPTWDRKVVTDGAGRNASFVTAAGPDYAHQFADAIAAILK